MLTDEQVRELQPALLTLMIICGSLTAGAIMLAVVLFVIDSNRQLNQSIDVVPLVGLLIGLGCFAAAIMFPFMGRAQASRRLSNEVKSEGQILAMPTIQKFAAALQETTIIRYALFEGAVFVNMIFWLMEGSLFSVAVAGVGLALMIVLFPFPPRAIAAIESMIDAARRM